MNGLTEKYFILKIVEFGRKVKILFIFG